MIYMRNIASCQHSELSYFTYCLLFYMLIEDHCGCILYFMHNLSYPPLLSKTLLLYLEVLVGFCCTCSSGFSLRIFKGQSIARNRAFLAIASQFKQSGFLAMASQTVKTKFIDTCTCSEDEIY